MTLSLTTYRSIKKFIEDFSLSVYGTKDHIRFVAVTKGHTAGDIIPLLKEGHIWFGENRLQEIEKKWPQLKNDFPFAKIQFIGPMQSNKIKGIYHLCDSIISIDRIPLVDLLLKEEEHSCKSLEYLVQVNLIKEQQKSGIYPENLRTLLDYCKKRHFNIQGLMHIPPISGNPLPLFKQMKSLADAHALKEISMGMSHDYEKAITAGATQVRIGSILFE